MKIYNLTFRRPFRGRSTRKTTRRLPAHTWFLPGLLGLLILPLACSRAPDPGEREVKFYQSPMHPWITSDEPGNCTICGMALTPVYEGEDAAGLPDELIKLSPTSVSVINVRTAPAVRAPLLRTIRVSGVLDDNENAHRIIAAHYDGRIEDVFVEHVGQFVERGAPLAALYSPELLYVVREYQNALQNQNRSVAENAGRRLVQFGLSVEQVNRLAGAGRDEYAIDVLAPMDGTILARHAYDGQYVETGEPIYEMGDLSVLWFHAEVYESDLSGIRLGQVARVTTPAVPGRTFEGKVTFIDPNFDPATRSTRVRIEVPNPVREGSDGMHRLLPHRAYAEAILTVDFGERLLAPRSAVLHDGRREVVYLDRGEGAYELRHVRTGQVGDEQVEILDGIAAGDRLVAEGALLIDAEAQMRQGLVEPQGPVSPDSAEPVAASLERFLQANASVSDALARDDLPAFHQRWPALRAAAAGLPAEEYPEFSGAIELARQVPEAPAPDLKDARKAFAPLSELAAELLLASKRAGRASPLHVYSCPMTDEAYEGAPSESRWVQKGAETRNPFFGARMLECGAEVKP